MSDRLYRAWIQRQPSCLSGKFSEWIDGSGRCLAAHVRRAGKSGVAFKAKYSCVPLRGEEHDYQHQHGELACFLRYFNPRYARSITIEGRISVQSAKRWFESEVELYFAKWLESVKNKQLQEVYE